MSKAIVKHGGGLQKPDDAERIERAKAAIWQGRGLSPAPETFDLYCSCAREDKLYTLRFVRQSSGLLRFRESVKGKPSSLPDNARAGGVGWTLRLDYFETGPTPCAWCGNGSFHHCASHCGALVCGGRITGGTFHCRKSCGASWVGVPLREVTGSVTREPRLASLSPAPRLAASPAKPMLLLPPGNETRAGGSHNRWGK
jgi:hypothetical protein